MARNKDQDRIRPEAGADTRYGKPGEGRNRRDGQSGGERSAGGSTYGDWVPTAGQVRRNDDRDATAPMGDHYTGGGNIDRLAEEPGSAERNPEAAEQPMRGPRDTTEAEKQETESEAKRNKGFDTTHVHSSSTSRKV